MRNLQQALGEQQGYLGAGLGLGDTAMNLYQQGLGNKSAAQQAGLGYLSSGQTPYQAGATYLANAEGAAGNAAQGGPQYNPASLGTSYSAARRSRRRSTDWISGARARTTSIALNNAYGGGGGSTKKSGRAQRAFRHAATAGGFWQVRRRLVGAGSVLIGLSVVSAGRLPGD